jgi:hypothetical protein
VRELANSEKNSLEEHGDQGNTVKLLINDHEIETHYIEFVNIEANAETIYINFLQKTLKDTDPVTAKIATRVALNWPHFVRVTRLFQQIIEEKRTEVLENLKKHLSDE